MNTGSINVLALENRVRGKFTCKSVVRGCNPRAARVRKREVRWEHRERNTKYCITKQAAASKNTVTSVFLDTGDVSEDAI